MYAIVEIKGTQYKVSQGETIDVDLMPVADGSKVELDNVLFIADGEETIVGTPKIAGAKVTATATGTVRGKKVIVLRYKAKTRYCKKTGQHQSYTQLTINKITKSKRKQKVKASSKA